MKSLKVKRVRRQRALRIASLFCATFFFLYAAVTLSGHRKHSGTASILRAFLQPAPHCASTRLEWFNASSSTNSFAKATAGSVNYTRTEATETAASAFDALHQIPQKDVQLAAAVWRSYSVKEERNKNTPPVVMQAHLNFSAMLSGVEPYPHSASSGRGIVMVSGGPKYSPPAYGNIAFLRRSGCKLPVEVWTPPHEPIPQSVAADFIALGNVTLRSLAIYPEAAHAAMRASRYLGKQLAILASQFSDILFLDADNIPLHDPTFLFEEPLYKQSGLLMWPDFWSCEVKAGAWEALRIPSKQRPTGSHESGQVVLDKQRCWKPLLVSIFLNMHGEVFYPLLSDNGQGDKETLPVSWLALGYGKYGLIPHPVLALGRFMPDGSHAGRAMMQRAPDGLPLFLHVHFPKISVPHGRLQTPPEAARVYLELNSEVTALPKGFDKAKARSYEVLNAVAGFDVEVELLHLRRYLRCQKAWVHCCLQ